MIEIRQLCKSYGGRTVVQDLDFTCPPGTVTGFLGANGAGKSTTMRMLVGLTHPTSGSATIGGRAFRRLPNPPREVGVMLDASAQHPGRTGRETLRLAAAVIGVPASRADEMLERVGLAGAASKYVRQYSLGMRQRLGIAQALMGDPRVLVLDEPANGMDPEGIRWMRELLRDFAERGGTVLLSSHLLAEVEATADRLVIIKGGRGIASGTIDELLGDEGVVARSTDQPAFEQALTAAGLAWQRAEDGAVRVQADTLRVSRVAAEAGVILVELRETSLPH